MSASHLVPGLRLGTHCKRGSASRTFDDRGRASRQRAPRQSLGARGYTLLEVLLALALGVLVVMLIGMAIDSQITVSQRGRGKVEEAQLARAVLRLIADDLQSTIHYAPQDLSSVASLNLDADVGELNPNADGQTQNPNDPAGGPAGNSNDDNDNGNTPPGDASGGPSGGSQPPGGQQAPGGSQPGNSQSSAGGNGNSNSANRASSANGARASSTGGTSGGSTTGAETSGGTNAGGAAGDAAAAETPVDVPGVYGSLYEIEIDISRLPRVDEYERMVQNGAGAIADLPSDIKTVGYYVAGAEGGSAASSGPGGALSTDQGGGLVRRSLDRAVTQFATSGGSLAALGDSGQILAPEVTGIMFGYFDGMDWLDYWDSAEMGGPPVAVEVTVFIRSPKSSGIASRVLSSISGSDEESEVTTYRQVVYLPASEAAAGAAPAATDTGMEAEADMATGGMTP